MTTNYQEKGIKIRSKCKWYEDGKNYSNFFRNLEKKLSHSKPKRFLKIGEKEVKEQSEILQALYQFYQEFFSKKVFNSNEIVALKGISLPKLKNRADIMKVK